MLVELDVSMQERNTSLPHQLEDGRGSAERVH